MGYYDNPGTSPDEAINITNGKVFNVVQLADSEGNVVDPGGGDSLGSIDSKLPELVDGKVPVDIGANINVSVENTSIEVSNDAGSPIPVSDAGGSLTVDATSLPLPTGAATSANQETANTSLGNINLKLPALVNGKIPVDANVSITGGATEAKQDTLIASVDGVEGLLGTIDADTGSIDSKLPSLSGGKVPVVGPLTDTELRASSVPVSPNIQQGGGAITSSTTRVTLATDGPGVSALSSIDSKTATLVSGRVPVDGSAVTQPVSGPLTDTQLRASAVPVSPNISRGTGVMDSNTTRVTLATDGPGLANLSSIAGLQIPAHDYISLSYTGSNLTGVTYKTGGSGGVTVGTLTLAYTGSQLTSVTRS